MITECIKDLTRELNHTLIEIRLFSWELSHDFGPFVPLRRFEGSLFSTLEAMQTIHSQLMELLDLAFAEQWMVVQGELERILYSPLLSAVRAWLLVLLTDVISPLRNCLYLNEEDSDKVDNVVAEVKAVLQVLSGQLHDIVYAKAPSNWGR